MSHHGMLLPFDTEGLPPAEDEQFCRGFEAGHVWTALRERLEHQDGLEDESFTVGARNAEMMLRIAEALELHFWSIELGDDWLEVTFSNVHPPQGEA